MVNNNYGMDLDCTCEIGWGDDPVPGTCCLFSPPCEFTTHQCIKNIISS